LKKKTTKKKIVKKVVKKTATRKVKPMPLSAIRMLVESYYDLQAQRIITNNRMDMNSERNGFKPSHLQAYGFTETKEGFEVLEKSLKKKIEEKVVDFDVYIKYLSRIKGIGPIIGAGLLGYIDKIKDYDNISKLWQASGFGMNTYCTHCKSPTYVIVKYKKTGTTKKTEAKRLAPIDICPDCNEPTIRVIQKRVPGYQVNYNPKFKVLVWKVGQSILKQSPSKSKYRKLYDKIKKQLEKKHPIPIKQDKITLYTKGHIHNMALRKVEKIFLANLWITWRGMEDLEVTEPYIVSKSPKHNLIAPMVDT
jgi:hypothetical protein